MLEEEEQEEYFILLTLIKFWANRRLILKIIAIFFVFGLFIVIFSKDEYTSRVEFISQNPGSGLVGGRLSGIAAMIGLNLNASTDESELINENLYQIVLNRLPLQKKLAETKLKFNGIKDPITFKEYYTQVYSPDLISRVIAFPLKIFKIFKKHEEVSLERIDSLIFVSKEEQFLRNKLKNNLLLEYDENNGIITLTATMPEPIAAAQLVQKAQLLLQEDIITYRIGKAWEQLNFIEEHYERYENNFKNAESNLANYKDRNRFNITESSLIELKRLQSEYELALSIFDEINRQRVAQSIKVEKDTPIFANVNPATVPYEPSGPNRSKIMLLSVVIGFIFAILWIIAKDYFLRFKENKLVGN